MKTTSERRQFVSYSGISQHRKCPQQWVYARVYKLEKDVGAAGIISRDFGSWWHTIMAARSIELGEMLGSLIYRPDWIMVGDRPVAEVSHPGPDGLVEDVIAAAAGAWAAMTVEDQAIWIDKMNLSLPARLRSCYVSWVDRWKPDLPSEIPLAVEFPWSREIVKDGNVALTLIGYVDEIYFDAKRNLIVVKDHKTSKTLTVTNGPADDLLGSQLQLYAWGAAPAVAQWPSDWLTESCGYELAPSGKSPRISAVGYDNVRSTGPKTPVLTQAGQLSKQVTDFDLRTYLDWVGEGIFYESKTRSGVYSADPAVIARLSTPVARDIWQTRSLVPLREATIREHLQAAVDTAGYMERTRLAVAEGRAPGRNLGSACSWCDFSSLCANQMSHGHSALDPDRLSEFGLKLSEGVYEDLALANKSAFSHDISGAGSQLGARGRWAGGQTMDKMEKALRAAQCQLDRILNAPKMSDENDNDKEDSKEH